MTRFTIFAVGCLALIALMAQSAQAVPVTSSFTARIADADGPITADVSLTFKIYDNPSGGTLVWEETHGSITPDTGLVFVELGAIDPSNNGLDATVFTGAAMFLEVSVNGNIQSPRVPILSVPYAIRAAVADTVVNETDPVFAAAVASGITAGDIAAWNSDAVLSEGQVDTFANNNGYSTGAHTTNTNTQLSGAEVLAITGAHINETQVDSWANNNGYSLTSHTHAGDISAVNPGAGLTGGGTTGSVTLSVSFAGTGTASTVARSDHSHGAGGAQAGRANLGGSDAIRTANSFTVAQTGTCIAWVHSYSYSGGNTTGYYFIRPYSLIAGVGNSFGPASVSVEGQNNTSFHTADDIGSWAASAGDTAAFGCSVSTNGTAWTLGEVTCNVAWLCAP